MVGNKALVCTVVVIALCFVYLNDAKSVVRRNTPPPNRICQKSTPCGWAVYSSFTKQVDYFMRNSCECPGNLTCGRTDDDLSISAYVYRCLDDSHAEKLQSDPFAFKNNS